MPNIVSVQCPGCGTKLRMNRPANTAAKVRCPKCKRPFPFTAGARAAKKVRAEDPLDALAAFQGDVEAEAPAASAPAGRRDSRPPERRARAKPKSDKKPRKRRRKQTELAEGEWPIKWIVLAVMLLVAFFSWGVAAASYARNEENWSSLNVDEFGGIQRMARRSLTNFLANAVSQMPNAPRITVYTFRNALWLIVTFAVIEVIVLLSGLKARSLQIAMSRERREVPP